MGSCTYSPGCVRVLEEHGSSRICCTYRGIWLWVQSFPFRLDYGGGLYYSRCSGRTSRTLLGCVCRCPFRGCSGPKRTIRFRIPFLTERSQKSYERHVLRGVVGILYLSAFTSRKLVFSRIRRLFSSIFFLRSFLILCLFFNSVLSISLAIFFERRSPPLMLTLGLAKFGMRPSLLHVNRNRRSSFVFSRRQFSRSNPRHSRRVSVPCFSPM